MDVPDRCGGKRQQEGQEDRDVEKVRGPESSTHSSDSPPSSAMAGTSPPDYKPIPLRWPFQIMVLILICCLIASLEYARQTYPVILDRKMEIHPIRRNLSQIAPAGTVAARGINIGTSSRRFANTTSLATNLTATSGLSSITSAVDTNAFPTTTPATKSENGWIKPGNMSTQAIATANYTLTNATAPRSFKMLFTELIQNPRDYPRLGYASLYLGLIPEWIHLPVKLGPLPYLPQGAVGNLDVSDRCVLHWAGVSETGPDDPFACIYIFAAEGGFYITPPNCEDDLYAEQTRMNGGSPDILPPEMPECWLLEIQLTTIFHFKSMVETLRAGSETITISTVTTGTDGHPTTLFRTTVVEGALITNTRKPGEGVSVHDRIVTKTDSLGQPIATITNPLLRLKEITLRDKFGSITGTTTTEVPVNEVLKTYTDFNGVPTKTVTEYLESRSTPSLPPSQGRNEPRAAFRSPSETEYLIVSFGPVFATTLLAILIQIFQANLNSMLPFHVLATRPGGSRPDETLYMDPSGLSGPLISWRLLFQFGKPLSFVSDLLVLLSAILVSLSSEAVGITLFGDCTPTSYKECVLSLAVVKGPALAVGVILGIMALLVVLTGILLLRWRTGVLSNPWSIVGVASLISHPETRKLFYLMHSHPDSYIRHSQIRAHLKGKLFALQHQGSKYGIVVSKDYGNLLEKCSPKWFNCLAVRRAGPKKQNSAGCLGRAPLLPQVADTALLLIVVGFLLLIIYYETTQLNSPFEAFMDNQGFGVSFLFVSIGTINSLFWDYFFSRIVMLNPYRQLSRRPRLAQDSILVARPMTVFTGLWQAIANRDPFIFSVAFAGVLSKFAPIFLSNIPFRLTLTWTAHWVSAWISVAILSFILLVLATSRLIKWPFMPVEPNTLAGCLYYVCDSEMLKDLDGVSAMNERDKEKFLRLRGQKYSFGKMVGASGATCIGVDQLGETA